MLIHTETEQENTPKTRLAIFENTQMACELLIGFLQRSHHPITVVAHSTGTELVDNAGLANVDVALVSAALKHGANAGLRLVRRICKSYDHVRSVILFDEYSHDQVVEAFRAGASGVVSRHDSCDTLCKCIQRVHEGQIWANSEQLRYILQALGGHGQMRGSGTGGATLTKREEQVAILVSNGMTNREIAARLHLSEHTVKNHLFRLFEKLGIDNRAELVRYLIEHGNDRSRAISA